MSSIEITFRSGIRLPASRACASVGDATLGATLEPPLEGTENMNVIGVGVNALVVSGVGLVLAWLGHGRFQALESRIDRLEDRMDARMDGVQTAVDGLRSDLTAVALSVGAHPRTGQTGRR
jgi:hypothetical protein